MKNIFWFFLFVYSIIFLALMISNYKAFFLKSVDFPMKKNLSMKWF